MTEEAVAAFAPDERPDWVVEVEVLLAVTEVPRFLAAAASRLSFSALLPIVVGERLGQRKKEEIRQQLYTNCHIFL